MKTELVVEEQHDERGDMIFAFKLFGKTHSRATLDHIAEQCDAELKFLGELR